MPLWISLKYKQINNGVVWCCMELCLRGGSQNLLYPIKHTGEKPVKHTGEKPIKHTGQIMKSNEIKGSMVWVWVVWNN